METKMAVWGFRGANWPTDFSSLLRGWQPMKNTYR